MNCPHCNRPTRFDGTQFNYVQLTANDLGTCRNPECKMFSGTWSCNKRPMTPVEIAANNESIEWLKAHTQR